MTVVVDGMANVVRVDYFEFWGVKQNLIPYMWQMVLSSVLIEKWIIDPYEY